MKTTSTTVCYPLIGHPVAQVSSPPVVNKWFANHGVDAVMFVADIPPDFAPTFVANLRNWENCGGCSVTIPHKQCAFDSVDLLTDRARASGSVNIIRRDADGTLHGDMTDGLALCAALTASGAQIADARILVVGAGGGAGAAISVALAEKGAGALCLEESDPVRLDRLCSSLQSTFPDVEVFTSINKDDQFDIAINATPLGMCADDPLPFSPTLVKQSGTIVDIVTKPKQTSLLTAASAAGLTTVVGDAMVQAQLPFQLGHLGLLRDLT
jgi:shikimate dehydrogenase